ncbi:MAG TPA: peptidase T [Pirellulales bacterium]|jgi:tripeptide aminopeptidase|nr:peptidase T [Pirellulales bacterium]
MSLDPPAIDAQRLLARFLRYVQFDTTAVPDASTYPSSAGQWELGRLLVGELQTLGLADISQSDHAIIVATLPATSQRPIPAIVWTAHLDTSPETSGANVRPQVWPNYDGADLVLPAAPERVLRRAENPELADCLGHTLVTSDGTTLLGADDKSGIASIMEAVACLCEHPEREHGPVRICFTCDEEIGHGVDHVDLGKLDAACCYTLDGAASDQIDIETFSADLATVTVQGVNIHPSIAKGRMVNAVRVAAEFVAGLPRVRLSPETTAGRQGFLHPYDIVGGVAEVKLKILLRDFDTARLALSARRLEQSAADVMALFPGSRIEVSVVSQYRNMAAGLAREPRAVEYAQRALERLGRTPRLGVIRGGTDGSRFTELGLPTPNLATGEHNPHSPLEWTSVEEMAAAAAWLVAIAQEWALH